VSLDIFSTMPPSRESTGREPAQPGHAPVFRTLQCATLAIAVASIAVVLLVAALRITYPYELEWMEGGVLQHIARLRAGQPIYVKPTFRFVPFIYPPLYYYVCSAVMWLVPDGFLGPRLVSLAASIGCMAVIFRFVHRESGCRLAALCAAALYAATFEAVGGWFDLARVDSLFPFFALSGAFLIRFGRGGTSAAAAGLLLGCAFLTKQSTLVFAAPLMLFHLVRQPRRFLVLLASGVVPCAVLAGYFHWRSDGWFTYYVFSLPRQHAVEPSGYVGFWLNDLLRHVPIALVMIVLLVAAGFRRWREGPAPAFYAALGLGGVAVSWLSRLHTGGEVNVLMPAFASIAIAFGLAIAYLPVVIDGLKEMGRAAKERLEALALVAVICQLLLLAFNPLPWTPTQTDRQTGDELVEVIRGIQGDVIIPTAPYLAARAGKPTTAHLMALMDVLRADGSAAVRRELAADVRRALRNPRYEAVLLCDPQGWFRDMPLPDDFVYVGEAVQTPRDSRSESCLAAYVPKHLFLRRRPAGSPQP
jgi:hypothetical protein